MNKKVLFTAVASVMTLTAMSAYAAPAKKAVKADPAPAATEKNKTMNINNPFYMVDGGFMSDTDFEFEHRKWRNYDEADDADITRSVSEEITYGFNKNIGISVFAGRSFGNTDTVNSYGVGVSFIPFTDTFKARVDASFTQDEHKSRTYAASAAVGYEVTDNIMPIVTFDYTHEDSNVAEDEIGNVTEMKTGAYIYGEYGSLTGLVGFAYRYQKWNYSESIGHNHNAEELLEAEIGYSLTDKLALTASGSYGFHNTRDHDDADDTKAIEIYSVGVGIRYVF